MTPPKTILVPTDLSDHSANAFRLVSPLARCFQSRVIVLSVMAPIEPFEMLGSRSYAESFADRPRAESAMAKLKEFVAKANLDVAHELKVEEGEPAEVIVRVARESGADLICMSSRGRGPFRRLLLGSVTAKVLDDAHIPVLTGAHLENLPALGGLKHVVCALNLDGNSGTIFSAARSVADAFGAKLTVVHALERRGFSREQAEAELRAITGNSAKQPEVFFEDDEPARVVHAVASKGSADLVVIGRSAPGQHGRLKRQSYEIVRESPCPVLSV